MASVESLSVEMIGRYENFQKFIIYFAEGLYIHVTVHHNRFLFK